MGREKKNFDNKNPPGGKRLYNIKKFLEERECEDDEECIKNVDVVDTLKGDLKLSYVRVSSLGQKDDLQRQKQLIREKYPDHIMIEDVGPV